MSDDALTALCADIIEEITAAKALELAGGLPTGHDSRPAHWTDPDRWPELTRTQLVLAQAAADPVKPGGKQQQCDLCGGHGDLVPGVDGPSGYHVCADERACEARKNHDYPPRADRVPEALLSAAERADAGSSAGSGAGSAAGSGGQQHDPPPEERAYVGAYGGWYDREGNFHAPGWGQLSAFMRSQSGAWSHAISGGAHTGHLLSGQPRPAHYGGPVLQEAQQAAQPPARQQPRTVRDRYGNRRLRRR
jgi:hypothetical protein